jgi:hypothetical protein
VAHLSSLRRAGYGDIVPRTRAGKIFCIFYIPRALGVVTLTFRNLQVGGRRAAGGWRWAVGGGGGGRAVGHWWCACVRGPGRMSSLLFSSLLFYSVTLWQQPRAEQHPLDNRCRCRCPCCCRLLPLQNLRVHYQTKKVTLRRSVFILLGVLLGVLLGILSWLFYFMLQLELP